MANTVLCRLSGVRALLLFVRLATTDSARFQHPKLKQVVATVRPFVRRMLQSQRSVRQLQSGGQMVQKQPVSFQSAFVPITRLDTWPKGIVLPSAVRHVNLPQLGTKKSGRNQKALLALAAYGAGAAVFCERMGLDPDEEPEDSEGIHCIDNIMNMPVPDSLYEALKDLQNHEHMDLHMVLPFVKHESFAQRAPSLMQWWNKMINARQHVSSLRSLQELHAAVHLYTLTGMRQMNRDLNTGDPDKIKPYFPYLRLLFEACKVLAPPSKDGQTLYRGVGGDYLREYPDAYKVGSTVTWWRVSSCTTNEHIANEFAAQNRRREGGSSTIFVIEARNGFDISGISHKPREKERLLLPGTRLQIMSETSRYDGTRVLHMREVDRVFII